MVDRVCAGDEALALEAVRASTRELVGDWGMAARADIEDQVLMLGALVELVG